MDTSPTVLQDLALTPDQEGIWLQQIQTPEEVLADVVLLTLEQPVAPEVLTEAFPEAEVVFVFDETGAIRPTQAPPIERPATLPADADPEAAAQSLMPESWDLQSIPALQIIPLSLPNTDAAVAVLRHKILADRLPFEEIAARLGANPEPLARAGQSFDDAKTAPLDTEGLILKAFRDALGTPDMGPNDDFFDFGGHSLVATRIIGELQAHHGITLRFADLFEHPTAAGLAQRATHATPETPPTTHLPDAESTDAPLSLAQESLWKAYAAFGYGAVFNIPFGLRFLSEVDEDAFGRAFGDLIARHPALRSHFTDASGTPRQRAVSPENLSAYRWFWTSQEAGTASRQSEAAYVFDLSRELPLRIRFFRNSEGLQELSLLFHHVVVDEWSLNLLMEELAEAYRQRTTGQAPIWQSQPPGFPTFAIQQRAGTQDPAHLAFWAEHLRDAPPARALLERTTHQDEDPAGGWVELTIAPEIAEGLRAVARDAAASVFNTVYAAIAWATGRLGGLSDMVIGTSASGRTDPHYFDTVGYFTTMTAHRVTLSEALTPRALITQVRDRINTSLPHSELPLDYVMEQISGAPAPQLPDIFEVFIQIHAQNKMNGALEEPNGHPIPFRQIDPDKSDSVLGLQFEIVEDVIEGATHLRIMMSYRGDHYGSDEVAQVKAAVAKALERFSQTTQVDQTLA